MKGQWDVDRQGSRGKAFQGDRTSQADRRGRGLVLILTFDVAQALASKAEVAREEKQNVGRAQVMRVGAQRPNQGAGV